MKTDYFLNLKNNTLSVNTYRLPDAAATTIDDLMLLHSNDSEETLTASIENELTLDGVRAFYTGLSGNNEFSYSETAEGLSGDQDERLLQSLNVWGLFEDETTINIIE